jgi:hypothetical protein
MCVTSLLCWRCGVGPRLVGADLANSVVEAQLSGQQLSGGCDSVLVGTGANIYHA